MPKEAIWNGIVTNIADIPPENVNDEFFCPECKRPAIYCRGNFKTPPFFRHARNTKAEDCSFYQHNENNNKESEKRYTIIYESTGETYDRSVEEDERTHKESKWHIRWKQKFPKDCTERIERSDKFPSGKQSRRADVMLGNLVIEFQHTDINQAEFWSRTLDWQAAGYRIVWVINYTKAEKDGEIVFENIETCDFLSLGAVCDDREIWTLFQEYLVFDCGGKGVVILSDFEKTEDGIKARKKQITSKEGFVQIAHFLGNQEVVPEVPAATEPKEVITVPKLENGGCYAYRYKNGIVYYLTRGTDMSLSYFINKYHSREDRSAICDDPKLLEAIQKEIRENGLVKITVVGEYDKYGNHQTGRITGIDS